MLRTQSPLLTRANPMTHLINSRSDTIINTLSAGRAVYLLRIYAAGTGTSHAKQLSNKKVIAVFPPDLMVKYETCASEFMGITIATTQINLVANALISGSVL